MKTAISVPDETFDRVERRAHELGMSRSEFYSRAASRYLDDLDADSVTEQINAVLDAANPDDATAEAVAVGRRVVADLAGDW